MSNDAPIRPVLAMYSLPSLAPARPVFDWLERLDVARADDPRAFATPLVIDLAAAGLGAPGARALVAALAERGVRVLALTGLDPGSPGADSAGLPFLIERAGALPAPAPAPQPTSRVLEGVRSGQRVENAGGDLTVIGPVSSGAEVVAGGSVHVLGALRGRAFAGGHVFCRRLEAELIAIGGAMLLADDIPAALRGRAVHAWAEAGEVRLAALD